MHQDLRKHLHIHYKWQTIKITFIHIPTGCNSCVENEALHVVLARGTERQRGEYTYGGIHVERWIGTSCQ